MKMAAPTAPIVPKVAIVGIDIGMTCTGVAVYSDLNPNTTPVALQKWPMGPGRQPTVVSKVPTKVAYTAGKAAIHSWGFKCPSVDKIGPAMAVKDMFKFLLDRDHSKQKYEKNFDVAPGNVDDAVLWYGDFLHALYDHIVNCLEDIWNVDFDLTKVEYHFCLPTSWVDNDRMIQMFTAIVEDAGFGNENTFIKLTEAEASAVLTMKLREHKFKEGGIFIVCDAGGATTDMCAMQVVKAIDGVVELVNLDQPKVLDVGSLNIDDLFESKATKVLDVLRPKYPHLPQHRAHHITRNEFEAIKIAFGTGKSIPIWNLSVSVESDNPMETGEPKISERIELTHEELKEMFDVQLEQIFEFINKEIEYLQWYVPDRKVSCLILAGGLGSSQYVQAEIIRSYPQVKVLFAPDPEDLPLAGCKGLVTDRLQNLLSHNSVIPVQSSSASYGILYSELHGKKHSGKPSTKHRVDGKRYAVNQIDWLIVKGQGPPESGFIKRSYYRVVDYGDLANSWRFGVVKSSLSKLPDSLDKSDKSDKSVTVVCWIVSDESQESGMTAVVPKRGFLRRKSKCLVEYELSAVVGPGKLRFEVKVAKQSQAKAQPLKIQWCEDELKEIGAQKMKFENGIFKSTA